MLKDLIDEINSNDELKKTEKREAIKNITEMSKDPDRFIKYFWNIEFGKRKMSLINCFYWAGTPQGFDYWDKITNGK